jgi:hypothetical protein
MREAPIRELVAQIGVGGGGMGLGGSERINCSVWGGGGLVCFPRSTARFTCPDLDLSIAFLFAALTVTYLSLHSSRGICDSIA